MRLTPGSRLGPYEVLSILGTGGMAEVYRARDTRLDADPSVLGLVRFDVRRRVTVEKRIVGAGGPGVIEGVHLTPDGKNIVFTQRRISGHLYVVRGLPGAR